MDLTKRPTHVTDFEELLRPHAAALYRLAFRFTGRREDAEDLVQDLLVKSYLRLRELTGLNDVRTWLVKVLYRMFVDQWRHQTRSPVGLADEGMLTANANYEDPLVQVPCQRPGPEEEAMVAQRQQQLLEKLSHLSDEHRVLLIMHDMEGYTLCELQAIMDVPLGTLKSRLHRARHALKLLFGHGASTAYDAYDATGDIP